MQSRPDGDISELGSVEDAAHLQLRLELKACLAERDRAISAASAAAKASAEKDAAAAKAIAERDAAIAERDAAASLAAELRTEVRSRQSKSLQAEAKMDQMRCTIRAAQARESRRVLRDLRPPRGEFQIDPNYAVPSNISERGALEKQVMSTDSISQENSSQPAGSTLGHRVQKKSRLMNIAETNTTFKPTARRKNEDGDFVGGSNTAQETKSKSSGAFRIQDSSRTQPWDGLLPS